MKPKSRAQSRWEHALKSSQPKLGGIGQTYIACEARIRSQIYGIEIRAKCTEYYPLENLFIILNPEKNLE